ncbi:uncharacterized protein LOC110033549 [Phalaenopsis equestris]|uniref:uncharacterized protein LOC110033549 n=1 Tax=Phalaenopsis equestris TaxID=78828 RepID=UPI0009E58EFF|nr:uncharacterized protein LOC110033549 [Phalaenopsis equestris]
MWVENSLMKFRKWSINFDPKAELPIISAWIRFPGLKLHLFNHEILFSLTAAYGKPLKMDHATFTLSRSSEAHILVERDITQTFCKKNWIDLQHQGYWQPVEIEKHSSYCTNCSMFGHQTTSCFHLNPQLKNSHNARQTSNPVNNIIFDSHDAPPGAENGNELVGNLDTNATSNLQHFVTRTINNCFEALFQRLNINDGHQEADILHLCNDATPKHMQINDNEELAENSNNHNANVPYRHSIPAEPDEEMINEEPVEENIGLYDLGAILNLLKLGGGVLFIRDWIVYWLIQVL